MQEEIQMVYDSIEVIRMPEEQKKSVVFRPGKEKLQKARERLNLEKRGSDEEYNEHLLGVMKSLEPARRRATKCLLS